MQQTRSSQLQPRRMQRMLCIRIDCQTSVKVVEGDRRVVSLPIMPSRWFDVKYQNYRMGRPALYPQKSDHVGEKIMQPIGLGNGRIVVSASHTVFPSSATDAGPGERQQDEPNHRSRREISRPLKRPNVTSCYLQIKHVANKKSMRFHENQIALSPVSF